MVSVAESPRAGSNYTEKLIRVKIVGEVCHLRIPRRRDWLEPFSWPAAAASAHTFSPQSQHGEFSILFRIQLAFYVGRRNICFCFNYRVL